MCVQFCRGSTTTLSVSERATASVAEWDGVGRGTFGLCLSGWCWAWRAVLLKPPSCRHGGRSTRPWWDESRLVGASRGVLQCGVSRTGLASFALECCGRSGNHTRAGTVPDRRGRCGMNQGRVRSVLVGRVLAGSVTSRCDSSCFVRPWRGVIDHGNHARAGTGLDQRQRRGMDCVGVRKVLFS